MQIGGLNLGAMTSTGSFDPLKFASSLIAQTAPSRVPTSVPNGNSYAGGGISASRFENETLSSAGQLAIAKAFGFDPGKAEGKTLSNAFTFGDVDQHPLYIPGPSVARSETNGKGLQETFYSQAKLEIAAVDMGYGKSPNGVAKAKEVMMAQEVAHKLVAAHPQLRGKINIKDNEIIGNAASLSVDSNFAVRNLLNAKQAERAPNYSEIRTTTEKAFNAINSQLNMKGSGADIMKRFDASVNGEESGYTEANLRAFAQKEGISPDKFMSALKSETTRVFTEKSQAIIKKALSETDYPAGLK